VDVGSSADGLLHISQLAADYVDSVADIVAAGQAVTVRVVSVDPVTKRIGLTMLDADALAAREERVSRAGDRGGDDAGGDDGGGDRRAPRRNDRDGGRGDGGARRSRAPPAADITLSRGDVVDGTISRVLPYGFFVDVGDGVAGLLVTDQLGDAPPAPMEEGTKLSVTVLSVDAKRRRVDLTLRSAEDIAAEAEVAARGASAGDAPPAAASPFGAALARAGLAGATFGAAKKKASKVSAKSGAPAAEVAVAAEPVAAAKEDAPAAAAAAPPAAAPAAAGSVSAATVKQLRDKSGAGMMDCKKALAECGGDVAAAAEYLRKKGIASADKKASRVAAEGEVAAYIHAGARLGVLVEVNCETDFVARGDAFRDLVADLAMQVAAFPDVTVVSVDDVPAEVVAAETEAEAGKEDMQSKPEAMRAQIVAGRVAKNLKSMALLEQPFIKDTTKTVGVAVKEAVAALGEKIDVRRFERFELGAGVEKKVADLAADVAEQTAALEAAAAARKAAAAKAPAEAVEAAPDAAKAPAVAVSAATVKALRDQSGAGMMDCKKALAECGGDVKAASEYLRKKGIASADKKASRAAAEGAIASYIHAGAALGVLIEVNCETDFVARGDAFTELVSDLAMQVAACPDVTVVSMDDVPAEELERERLVEAAKDDLAGKPAEIVAKIVDGRVRKIAAERALLEQPYIKDNTKTVGDVVKAAVAALGENIVVRRFSRYNRGEGIEKRVDDFAAEVAAQTGGAA
jgi:elongation factor Ts